MCKPYKSKCPKCNQEVDCICGNCCLMGETCVCEFWEINCDNCEDTFYVDHNGVHSLNDIQLEVCWNSDEYKSKYTGLPIKNLRDEI